MVLKAIGQFFNTLRNQTYAAFSLIELGIVLLIIGVLAGAIFKGQELLQTAKITSVLDEVSQYKNAVLLYQSTYGEWPGDDNRASEHFHNAEDGDGDGVVQGDDCDRAWQHLTYSGSISHGDPPASKIGGNYRIVSNPDVNHTGLYLVLGEGANSLNGLFTPKQASKLKNKAQDGGPGEGVIRFINGADNPNPGCLNAGEFDQSHENSVCVMLVKIS